MTKLRRLRVVRALIIALLFGPQAFGAPPAEATPGNIILEQPAGIRPDLEGGLGGGGGGGGGGPSLIVASTLEDTYRVTQTLTRADGRKDLRIALVSSGVDRGIFPDGLGPRITLGWGDDFDTFGYGDYAASVAFQLVSATAQLSITSFNIYPTGRLDPNWLIPSLSQVILHPNDYDVVLLAFPPSDLLDPITAAMASNQSYGGRSVNAWEEVLKRSLRDPYQSTGGDYLGIPTNDTTYYSRYPSYETNHYVSAFRRIRWAFDYVAKEIKDLRSLGLSVVMPAGDLGPAPQSIMGLANMPEVLTVGGMRSTNTVSPKSSAGPSLDLNVKPDLLAPTGIVGLVKNPSTFRSALLNQGLTASSAAPAWPSDAGSTPTVATPSTKFLADTSLTSAALTAIAVAGITEAGLRNPALTRGALAATSSPVTGQPSWRQGFGTLGGPNMDIRIADKALAVTHPLITSLPTLGMAPDSGAWSSSISISAGSASGSTPAGSAITETVTATVDAFIGVDLAARTVTHEVTVTAQAPVVTISVSARAATITVGSGMDQKQAGAYCGFAPVRTYFETTVTSNVPLCLTNAFEPVARALYPRSASIDGNSFSFNPAIPPGESPVSHPLAMIPLTPVGNSPINKDAAAGSCQRFVSDTSTYSDTCHGLARVKRVLPGYYLVSHFADYSAPTQYPVTQTSGSSVSTEIDTDVMGQPIGYSAYHSLILPRATKDVPANGLCDENYGPWDDWAGHEPDDPSGDNASRWCTEKFLDTKFVVDAGVPKPYRYEPETGGFVVNSDAFTPPRIEPLRVHFGSLRKPAQSSVSSRFIDIIDPCKHTKKETKVLGEHQTTVANLLSGTPAGQSFNDSWSFVCGNGLLANKTPSTGDGSVGLGIMSYPFNLTIPNYTTELNLNFAYQLTNAFIVVVVRTGTDIAMGIVTPQGQVTLPPGNTQTVIDLSSVKATGSAEGKAHFEFHLVSDQASTGTITFTFVPAPTFDDSFGQAPPKPYQPVVSSAIIENDASKNQTFSIEVCSWAVDPWKPVNYVEAGPTSTLPVDPATLENGMPLLPPKYLYSDKQCDADHRYDCGNVATLIPLFNPVIATPVTGGGYRYGGGQIGEVNESTGAVTPTPCRDISKFENGVTETAHVCEDWVVLVHTPMPRVDPAITGTATSTATSSALIDLLSVPGENYNLATSVVSDLVALGGKLAVPEPVTHTARTSFAFDLTYGTTPTGTLNVAVTGGEDILRTVGGYYEQLVLPMAFIARYPGNLMFCTSDGGITATVSSVQSLCRGSFTRSSPTAPWVRQAPTSTTVAVNTTSTALVQRDWGPALSTGCTVPGGYLGCGAMVTVTSYMEYISKANFGLAL